MRYLTPLLLVCTSLSLAAQNTGLQLANGVDSYLDVPYSPTIVPRSGLTFEAWITYNDTTLGPGYRWPTVVRQNSAPGAENYMLRVNAANNSSLNLIWMVRTGGGGRTVTWTFASGQLMTWTHVAGTYDGANVRLFINGTEVGVVAGTGAVPDTGNTLRLGNGDLSAPGIEQWNGEIDEVRLWPFARTAAEIASTMNYELSSVPGEISTWNLNGDGQDSSGSNPALPVNSPTFAANSLSLVPFNVGGANFGSGTAGCNGVPRGVMTTFARVGSNDFAVGAIRSTATGAGVLWLGTRNLNTPINLFGVNLWIDPAAPNVLAPVPGGPLGYARIPLAIPNNRFLANRQVVLQTIWAEPGCTVALFAADGLAVVIVP